MGYVLNTQEANQILRALGQEYDIYAPKRFPKQGRFSDTDVIRYDRINGIEEIVWQEKSDYPAKEVINPIQQALFYFTEDEYRASKTGTKPILIFARPCDINAQKVQAKILAGNGGFEDLYYTRVHERVKFVLMDCAGGDDTCFCVSMGANTVEASDYAAAVRFTADGLTVGVEDEALKPYFAQARETEFTPAFVTENELKAEVPEIPDKEVLTRLKGHPMWKQFDSRCISCGACTIACSTCTCFTTRDVIYGDNPEVGERRRVAASCQIEGFADMAGGHTYRTTAGERMRYKILHKFHDYKARFGERHMCVGCGRCIHRCPEFITITSTVEQMNRAVAEIRAGLGK